MKTASQECTIIMYHYVRNVQGTPYPEIQGLSVENFKKQVDYILRYYSVISLREYIDAIHNKKTLPSRVCILTFDDGYKDHYINVFPILKEKKLPATFFMQTQPLVEYTVPAVHKNHFLLAKVGARVLAAQFNEIVQSKFPELAKSHLVDGLVKKDARYKWDDALTANLKVAIAELPADVKNEILDSLFARHFSDEKKFCQELYMNIDEMKEMAAAGMSFGGHCHTHPSLSALSKKEQEKEIVQGKEILEKSLKEPVTLFAYPYGNYNNNTIDILKQHGFVCGLTTNFDINQGEEIDLFRLKRLDANDVPFE